MTTWGLVVETAVGTGKAQRTETFVVGQVSGSREEALAELERRARVHVPDHPRSPRRRRLFREGDAYLLLIDGVFQSFATRFTVAELLEDSATPATPKPVEDPGGPDTSSPESAEEPEPVVKVDGVDRYADGVPGKPAWLGRGDLL